MKLRNKKTGEIVEAHEIDLIDNYVYLKIFRVGDYDTEQYNSLAELNEEWEDYEEPKEHWYIDYNGSVKCLQYLDYGWQEEMRFIGNYFETKEEAEKAVEKLKAWKRLKDKGFRFNGKTYETDKRFGSVFYEVDKDTYSEDIIDDLDLLFGGE